MTKFKVGDPVYWQPAQMHPPKRAIVTAAQQDTFFQFYVQLQDEQEIPFPVMQCELTPRWVA